MTTTRSPIAQAGTVAAALGLLLTAGCSLPFERDSAPAAAPASTEGAVPLGADGTADDAGQSSAQGSEQGGVGAVPTTPPTRASTHELRYVNPDAPACSVVWSPGAMLAVNYEWCRDEDGEPVAGVRIGSCEVVTHHNQMYAVPGQRIMAAIGEIHLDQQFAQLLTSCKRHPYVR